MAPLCCFLDYHGSSGLSEDNFTFLVGEKVEQIAFREDRRTLLARLNNYIIPLHEWEEYLTFYTEYFKDTIKTPDIKISIQSIPITAQPRKLPSNVIIEVLPDLGCAFGTKTDSETTENNKENDWNSIIPLQKRTQY